MDCERNLGKFGTHAEKSRAPHPENCARPAEGCADTVKAGLQAFIDTQCNNFETYLADQYEIAKNAKLETLDDGTIVMVMCANADAVYDAIVAALAA